MSRYDFAVDWLKLRVFEHEKHVCLVSPFIEANISLIFLEQSLVKYLYPKILNPFLIQFLSDFKIDRWLQRFYQVVQGQKSYR